MFEEEVSKVAVGAGLGELDEVHLEDVAVGAVVEAEVQEAVQMLFLNRTDTRASSLQKARSTCSSRKILSLASLCMEKNASL